MTDREALIAEIRDLASRGHSGGEIGAHLGLTRGAVAGLCSRNGIRLAGTSRSATVAADKPAQKPRKDRSGNGCLWPMWGDQERATHVERNFTTKDFCWAAQAIEETSRRFPVVADFVANRRGERRVEEPRPKRAAERGGESWMA